MSSLELPPGDYYYENLEVGHFFKTSSITITEDKIRQFSDLSGDFFEIHNDDVFAQSQGFPSKIAHGLLVLAITDGLKNNALVKLKATASLGWNWKFLKAVLPGDSICATIRVASKRISSKGHCLVTLNLSVNNQNDEPVQSGDTNLILRSHSK
jgi:acyl dehydratase